jgi:hypothetical protein
MDIFPLSRAIIVYGAHLTTNFINHDFNNVKAYLDSQGFKNYNSVDEWDFYNHDNLKDKTKKTQIVFGIEGFVLDVKFFTNRVLL